jgi:hypothetical protein
MRELQISDALDGADRREFLQAGMALLIAALWGGGSRARETTIRITPRQI